MRLSGSCSEKPHGASAFGHLPPTVPVRDRSAHPLPRTPAAHLRGSWLCVAAGTVPTATACPCPVSTPFRSRARGRLVFSPSNKSASDRLPNARGTVSLGSASAVSLHTLVMSLSSPHPGLDTHSQLRHLPGASQKTTKS